MISQSVQRWDVGIYLQMNKSPEIVLILSIKYIKYKVGGLKNLFADEQKSRNSSHASKLVPTQQEGFGPASDFFLPEE